MWLSLACAALAEKRSLGSSKALKHSLGSLRALLHPGRSRRAEAALGALDASPWLPAHERHFYVRHRFYLSKRLSIRQRIDSCLHHYAHEEAHFSARYRRQVYGGEGLTLWQETVGANSFSLRLAASSSMRREGDLSLHLLVDGVAIHVLSFSYVDAALFGEPSAPVLFITRNQGLQQEPEQLLFRTAFKQTVPPYFCLSAAMGIALAQGMQRIAAVRHEAQIACTAEIVDGLRNSYDGFWSAFKGTALDVQAYAMPVPLVAPPLSEVPPKHRKRARDRREKWSAVALSAQAAIAAELRSRPLPRTATLELATEPA
jgi:uncharacterized protein